MRRSFVLLAIIVIAVCIEANPAQGHEKAAHAQVYVRSLRLESHDLTPGDCMRLELLFRGKRYVPAELQERVRLALRDKGFYKAKVGSAQLTHRTGGPESLSADFRFKITTGARYRLASIGFASVGGLSKDSLVFPAEQLRAQFPIADGDVFRATAIAEGLQHLRQIYTTNGYVNFGAMPRAEVDEMRHTVALTIEEDRGKRYYFSRLFLDGVEPHAGDAAALFEAWTNLKGQPYNPDSVARWVASYAPYWPDSHEAMRHISTLQHSDSQLIDVHLDLP